MPDYMPYDIADIRENVVVITNKQQNYIMIIFLTNNTQMTLIARLVLRQQHIQFKNDKDRHINISERDNPQVIAALAMA